MEKRTKSVGRLVLFSWGLAALAGAAGSKPLDEGRLDAAWFAGVGEFHEAEEIDYLWVKPGFALDGRNLRFVAWPEPEFLGPQAGERDTKDKRLAQEINGGMPEVFATAFRNAFAGAATAPSTTNPIATLNMKGTPS